MSLKKPIRSLTWKNWLLLFLLTILLFVCFLFYNTGNFVFEGEGEVLTKLDNTREMISRKKYKPPYSFIFVNVAKDLELVKDENGGDNVITDRQKLSSFFKILADRNQHTYLIADIFFDIPSDHDNVLASELRRLRHVVFPKHLSDSGILPSVITVPSAVADYNTNTKRFSKFRLIYRDSLKTIPVIIHEELQHVKYSTRSWGVFCNGSYCMQPIAPRYYIKPEQFIDSRDYPYFNLGDLLILSGDSSFYDQFLKNRFILLGNFETDVHATPVGKMPGTLILLNTYLSLLNGKHQPSAWWFVTVFVLFFLINLYLLFGEIKIPKIPDGKKWWQLFINNQVNGFLANFISIAALCLLITIVSDFIFHVTPHTFIIFMYIIIYQGFTKYYNAWKKERN